jgi:uncharacterized protein YciI
MPRYVLFYRSADNVAQRAPEHVAAHAARCQEYADAGSLLGYGTFGDPQAQGSMAIFTTREAAERFVDGDPFIRHGVVAGHEIREWNDGRSGP